MMRTRESSWFSLYASKYVFLDLVSDQCYFHTSRLSSTLFFTLFVFL